MFGGQRTGRRGKDAMQVCKKGHLITADYHSDRHSRSDYCPDCGSETIHECPECKGEIPGRDRDSAVVFAITDEHVPSHCEDCGSSFPWEANEGGSIEPESDLESMMAGFSKENIESDKSNLSEDEMKQESCDHSPEHKEITTIPKSGGISAAGFGGNVGTGDTVIVCKVCETMYNIEDSRENKQGSPFF